MEKKKRWYILGRIEVAYWIDRLHFARKRVGGNSEKETKVNSHAKKGGEAWWRGLRFFFGEYEKDNWGERGGFFGEESLKIEGDVWGKRKKEKKKESSGRILGDFLFFNEIQKKMVDMEIMFPGGTSKGGIGWFGDSLWWRNTRARSKK